MGRIVRENEMTPSYKQIALLGVSLYIFMSFSSASAEDIDSCASIDKCMQRIYEVAEPPQSKYSTVSEKEWAVAKRIGQFGDEAVDRLIPLLKDSNDDVAQIAAVALSYTKSIDKKHLQQIIEALDSEKDLDWLPPALGRIDSQLAAEEAVKRFLVSKYAPGNQEAYAIKLSGRRAIPYIIKAAKCGSGCGRDDYYNLGYVLGEMDDATRVETAKSLVGSLFSSSTSNKTKAGIIYMISFLKQSALVIESELISLKEKQPELEDAVNHALIGMSSKQAGAIFANKLNIEPSYLILRDLAEIGSAGIDAGPIVTGLLNHSDWNIRLAAARTLGFIKYKKSVPKLIAFLDQPSDVKLNWVAAESLGRIADKTAIDALTKTSSSHWHTAVREAVSKAIENIKSNTGYQSRFHRFVSDFNGYSHFGVKACKEIVLKEIKEPADTKLSIKHAKEKLKTLLYPSEIVGFGAADKEEQLAADPDAVIEVRADNMIEKRSPIDQIPDIALRTENGWLAGSSRGEWGGELVYIADGEKPVTILDKNIKNIYKLGNRYIAVAGIAHMGLNTGIIYELTSTANGGWSYQSWRTLPGAPQSSWLVETGELLVNTFGGGSILISHNGSMRMAQCLQ